MRPKEDPPLLVRQNVQHILVRTTDLAAIDFEGQPEMRALDWDLSHVAELDDQLRRKGGAEFDNRHTRGREESLFRCPLLPVVQADEEVTALPLATDLTRRVYASPCCRNPVEARTGGQPTAATCTSMPGFLAALGDRDGAVAALQAAYAQGFTWDATSMLREPAWPRLRDCPPFVELMKPGG